MACSSKDDAKKSSDQLPAPLVQDATIPISSTSHTPQSPVIQEIVMAGGFLSCINDGGVLSYCKVIADKKTIAELQPTPSKFTVQYRYICLGNITGFGLKSDEQEFVLNKTDSTGATVNIFGVGPVIIKDVQPVQTEKAKLSPDCIFSIDKVVIESIR